MTRERKQNKTTVIINDEIGKNVEYLIENGINISFEFRKMIKKLYNKKIKENEENL